MTVDRPAISSVGLRCIGLCSRRRVALFVVASALLAALLLTAHQASSLHAFRLQSKTRRWPALAAGLSLGQQSDPAATPTAAAHADGTADKKLQAIVAVGEQATDSVALLASSFVGDGRAVTVRITEAATSAVTAHSNTSQRSSAVDVTVHVWSTARSIDDSAAAPATAADAATPAMAVKAAAVQTAAPLGSTSHLTATRPIVYVRFIDPMAGLGNKMFQYASGVGLALRHGAEARLVEDHAAIRSLLASMRSVFRMSTLSEQPNAPSPADAVTLSESGWGRYNAAQFDKRSNFEHHNTTVIGYLQSWRYFEPVASHIRSEFALLPRAASLADAFLSRSDNGTKAAAEGNGSSNLFVGVHVRRGDMVRMPMLYTVAPPEFLLKAMDYYVAKYGADNQLTFVIATNDHDWVKSFVDTRLPKHIRVLRVQFTPAEDMAVLSRCNHSIVTAGTFGWWSAWLAGGDVVYYKDFIRPSSQLYTSHDPSDYYPPHWLGMS